MKRFGILFILFNLTIIVYSQNKSLGNWGYSAYGEWFNRVVNGKKEGVWIERKNNIAEVGIYKNSKRDSIWQTYNINTGELLKEKNYSERKIRKIRAQFEYVVAKSKDTLVHVKLTIFDKSINKNIGTWKTNPILNDVDISIINQTDSTDRNFEVKDGLITLLKHRSYKIKLSKKGYITKSISIVTILPKNATARETDSLSMQYIEIKISNKVTENDPMILDKVSNIYVLRKTEDYGVQLSPDPWYLVLQKRKLSQLNEYEKKQKIIEIENSVNEQILNLKEEQSVLENQKKINEAELKHQEEEVKRKQLELELLAKDKSVSDLIIKTKEAELIKNQLLANEKKREIENLNQQKLINELNIKNKESELFQKNIEADNRQKQIKGLEHEKELSDENSKQQTFIRNLVLTGAGFLSLFLVFVFISLSKSRKTNRIIALQHIETEKQKHLVEEKHREITDSINYAERIQRSFLATKEQLAEKLNDYFVLFQPKDVVSGDFYWAHTLQNGNFALATADSTGHGVPGAIMSLLNTSSLERAVELGISEPAEILNHTRQTIIERLKKDGSAEGGKDGMDCSLISFNIEKSKFIYAAANNPIWIIRNKELIELAPDKIPVGKHDRDSISFTQHEVEIQKDDMIYTLTDGFPDQFGGPKGKKFMYKQLKETLVSISDKPLAEQKQTLDAILKDWMGDTEQVDDITIIGIRI
jgi:serine phosphatase RsbU (regulator of sigma subunit)